MKITKIVSVAAALAVSFAACDLLAGTTNEVASVNVVGYIKINVVSNKYIQVGMPFDSVTNGAFFTISEILGTNDIAHTTSAMVWTGTGYNTETFNATQHKWFPNTNKLYRGDAFWIKPVATTNMCVSGQVPLISTPQVIDVGYQMVTFPYPIDITNFSSTYLGTNANADSIMKFNGTGYQTWTFNTNQHKWFPTNPPLTIKVGEGVWYRAVKPTNYVEQVPYTMN